MWLMITRTNLLERFSLTKFPSFLKVFQTLRASVADPERRDEHNYVPDDSSLRESSSEQQHHESTRARFLR